MKAQFDQGLPRYEGQLDPNRMRIGCGEESYTHKNEQEYYKGRFFRDTYHGQGIYYTKPALGSAWAYEGTFYSNMKDGLGMLSYGDNSYFIGIYKDDAAFGPGMWVEGNGGQNIGFWEGSHLVRLIYPVSQVKHLGTNKINKFKVLRYRKIVNVKPEIHDHVNAAFAHTAADMDLSLISDRLLSIYSKNPLSHLFMKSSFDEGYLDDLMCAKDVYTLVRDTAINSMEDLRIRLEESLKPPPEPSENLMLTKSTFKSKKKRKKKKGKTKNEQSTSSENSPDSVKTDADKSPKENSATKLVLTTRPSAMPLGGTQTLLKAADSFISSTSKNDMRYPNDQYQTTKLLEWEGDSMDKFLTSLHLIAWNNSKIMIDMMVHAFKNRNAQGPVPMNFGYIMCGLRNKFRGKKGYLEIMSKSLLDACSKGKINTIKELVFTWNLDVNLSDSKGNSCLLRAVANDNHQLIKLLLVFGADPDILNDEGFSSLTHTLCRYLALKRSIKDWGNAFLPPTRIPPDENVRQWMYDGKVTTNLKKVATSIVTSKLEVQSSEYVFDFVPPPEYDPWPEILEKQTKKGKKKKGKQSEKDEAIEKDTDKSKKDKGKKMNKPKKKGAGKGKKNQREEKEDGVEQLEKSGSRLQADMIYNQDLIEEMEGESKVEMRTKSGRRVIVSPEEMNIKLEEMEKTIFLLTHIGGDLNASEVPAPPILLALLTGIVEMIELLLTQGADPNARLIKEVGGNLTPMHVLVLSPPMPNYPEILQLLIDHGGDVNLMTSEDFDEEGQKFLLQLLDQTQLETLRPPRGFTPIQALCFRPNVFLLENKEILEEMLNILIRKSRLSFLPGSRYLGHSPLSLAVTRSNNRFVNALLAKSKYVDANEDLGLWANPLSVLLCYKGFSPLYVTYLTLFDLIKFGANPLRLVKLTETNFEVGNLFDYAQILQGKLVEHLLNSEDKPPPTAEEKEAEQDKEKKKKEGKKQKKGKGKKNKKGKKSDGPTLPKDVKMKVAEFQNKIGLLENVARAKLDRRLRALLLKQLIRKIQEGDLPMPMIYSQLITAIRLWFTPSALIDHLEEGFRLGIFCVKPSDVSTAISIIFPPIDKRLFKKRHKKDAKMKEKLRELEVRHKMYQIMVINKMESIFEKCNELICSKLVKDPTKATGRKIETTYKLTVKSMNADRYPELDPSDELYRVCYNCIRRNVYFETCPRCQMVNFCCEYCNLMDYLNEGTNAHNCKLLFYGRGPKNLLDDTGLIKMREKIMHDFGGAAWKRGEMDLQELVMIGEEEFKDTRSNYLNEVADMEDRRRVLMDQMDRERKQLESELSEIKMKLLAEEEEKAREMLADEEEEEDDDDDDFKKLDIDPRLLKLKQDELVEKEREDRERKIEMLTKVESGKSRTAKTSIVDIMKGVKEKQVATEGLTDHMSDLSGVIEQEIEDIVLDKIVMKDLPEARSQLKLRKQREEDEAVRQESEQKRIKDEEERNKKEEKELKKEELRKKKEEERLRKQEEAEKKKLEEKERKEREAREREKREIEELTDLSLGRKKRKKRDRTSGKKSAEDFDSDDLGSNLRKPEDVVLITDRKRSKGRPNKLSDYNVDPEKVFPKRKIDKKSTKKPILSQVLITDEIKRKMEEEAQKKEQMEQALKEKEREEKRKGKEKEIKRKEELEKRKLQQEEEKKMLDEYQRLDEEDERRRIEETERLMAEEEERRKIEEKEKEKKREEERQKQEEERLRMEEESRKAEEQEAKIRLKEEEKRMKEEEKRKKMEETERVKNEEEERKEREREILEEREREEEEKKLQEEEEKLLEVIESAEKKHKEQQATKEAEKKKYEAELLERSKQKKFPSSTVAPRKPTEQEQMRDKLRQPGGVTQFGRSLTGTRDGRPQPGRPQTVPVQTRSDELSERPTTAPVRLEGEPPMKEAGTQKHIPIKPHEPQSRLEVEPDKQLASAAGKPKERVKLVKPVKPAKSIRREERIPKMTPEQRKSNVSRLRDQATRAKVWSQRYPRPKTPIYRDPDLVRERARLAGIVESPLTEKQKHDEAQIRLDRIDGKPLLKRLRPEPTQQTEAERITEINERLALEKQIRAFRYPKLDFRAIPPAEKVDQMKFVQERKRDMDEMRHYFIPVEGDAIRVDEKLVKPISGLIHKRIEAEEKELSEREAEAEEEGEPKRKRLRSIEVDQKRTNIVSAKLVPWFDTLTGQEYPKPKFKAKDTSRTMYLVDHITGKPQRFLSWDETAKHVIGGDSKYPTGWAHIESKPKEAKDEQIKKREEPPAPREPLTFKFGPRGQFDWYEKPKPLKDEDMIGVPLHLQELMYRMASQLGPEADLSFLFPFMVIRNGELYYKFYGEQKTKENYSFN